MGPSKGEVNVDRRESSPATLCGCSRKHWFSSALEAPAFASITVTKKNLQSSPGQSHFSVT